MDERLTRLIAEVLEVDDVSDVATAVRNEHSSWDSLAHLTLVTAVEEEFGVRFTMDEIESIETARDFSEVLKARS
jgi:acyl carrier protein